jgi:hypothetical protein
LKLRDVELTSRQLASRRNLDAQSLWLLSGLAHRLGETMGIHREAAISTLLPFEAEIRRRLWWQILIIEGRSAQLSGINTDAAFAHSWDTKRPLNINDSDLSPLMREPPAEHAGVTEMLFCTLRFDVGETMRKLKTGERNGMTVEGKMRVIDELAAKLEPRLSRCDASIPLHLLAMFMGKSVIAQLSLGATNPLESRGDGGVPREERDRQFELALQILGYDAMGHSNQAIRPFLWHIDVQFPFEAFIVLLSELQTRTRGEDAARGWMAVDQAYEDHPELVERMTSPLYVAMGSLAVQAWERRIAAVGGRDPMEEDGVLVESHALARLREQRERKRANSEAEARGDAMDEGGDGLDFGLDAEELGWSDWQGLLQGGVSHGGFMR